ncbi:hypothetical protein ACWIGW_41505 [Nocardia brasiliensis]
MRITTTAIGTAAVIAFSAVIGTATASAGPLDLLGVGGGDATVGDSNNPVATVGVGGGNGAHADVNVSGGTLGGALNTLLQ